MCAYRRIASLKSPAELRRHAQSIGAAIPCDDTLWAAPESPLAQPLEVEGRRIGNRFAILPMEGWDGTLDGRPGELTLRRWRRFGISGAKLIWGGEAVAVRHDGRANPNQLLINSQTVADLATLRGAGRRTRPRVWRHERPGRRLAIDALGPVCASGNEVARAAADRLSPPGARSQAACSARAGFARRPRDRRPDWRFRAAPPAWRPTPASTWSTSSIVTAIWGMNSSVPSIGRVPGEAAWRIARGSCARSSPASVRKGRSWRSAFE